MKTKPLAITLAALCAPHGWPAEPSTGEEIDYLIGRVAASGAHFIRNGSEYTGAQAASHLRMKLAKAGGRVHTAEEFIDGIASKSSLTGRPYELHLADGRTMRAAEWLSAELAHHRAAEQR